jgi:hypothetical protein
MRCIDEGGESIQVLCGIMAVPLLPPSGLCVYIEITGFAVSQVSKALMREAGREAAVANVDHHTSVQCITEVGRSLETFCVESRLLPQRPLLRSCILKF